MPGKENDQNIVGMNLNIAVCAALCAQFAEQIQRIHQIVQRVVPAKGKARQGPLAPIDPCQVQVNAVIIFFQRSRPDDLKMSQLTGVQGQQSRVQLGVVGVEVGA